MIRPRREVVGFARSAMKTQAYLGVNVLITTVTIITGATESYIEYDLWIRALIHYALMVYYMGFMYYVGAEAVYYGLKQNVPLVVSVCALYFIASFPDAFIQHVILKNDDIFAVLLEMFETATILFPGVIIFLLYLGPSIKYELARPASDCPVWRPVERKSAEDDALSDEILLMQAQNQYTRVTARNVSTLVRMPLSAAIEKVDKDEGWQVHRSYWIRKSQVAAVKFKKGNPRIIDKQNNEVPVSRKMVKEIKAYLEAQPG